MKSLFQRRKPILWRIPIRKGPPQGSIGEAVDALWKTFPPAVDGERTLPQPSPMAYYIKFSSIVEFLENEKVPQPTVNLPAHRRGFPARYHH